MKAYATPASPAQDKHDTARPLQKRARATRHAILQSVTKCLDELGYAETSFRAVQASAGLSRGSINYHFPTRHDMIVAAAEQLLENAKAGAQVFFATMQNQPDGEAYQQITPLLWSKIVNTAEGRAFVELLAAARTDPRLESALQKMLDRWDAEIEDIIRASSPNGADVMVITWDLCRTYLRGLLLQARFASDAEALQAKVDQFATVLSQFVSQQSVEE